MSQEDKKRKAQVGYLVGTGSTTLPHLSLTFGLFPLISTVSTPQHVPTKEEGGAVPFIPPLSTSHHPEPIILS